MKKIAMSVATATMLLGGLVGCGADDQATNMGVNRQTTGYQAQDMRDGTATTGRQRGEGPLTDMMTPDRRDGVTGQGQAGRTRQRNGLFGTQGRDNRTGFGGQGGYGLSAGDGQARTHLNNYRTRSTLDERGVGYTNNGRDNFGTNQGLFGTQGTNGVNDRQGTRKPGMGRAGFTNQNTADHYRANERPGMGGAGLTGGNRPGMVDEDGILRGRARGGTGALGNYGYRRQGQGAMNLEPRDRGNINQGIRNQAQSGTLDRGNRTGVHQGQQRTRTQDTINYHKDYDGKTVQQLSRRVERIEGVDEARVIAHDDDVVIGITTSGDMDNVKNKVERTVKGLADGKNVRVVTDSDAVGRIRTMDNELRTGTAFEEVGATFTEMLNDLGRAVQRPFERSR
jgi:hypothetical protein